MGIPFCIRCKHSDEHRERINFPPNDYGYYTWVCMSFGCNCELYDKKYIRDWDSHSKEKKGIPRCLDCGHSDEHREGIYYPGNDYPYYTWSCTNYGCECVLTDKSLII